MHSLLKNKYSGLFLLVVIFFGLLWYSVRPYEVKEKVSFEQKLKCETLGRKLLELRKDKYISVRDYYFVYSEKLDTCLYIADEIMYKDEAGYNDRGIIIDILTNQTIASVIMLASDEPSEYTRKRDAFIRVRDLYIPEVSPDTLGLPPFPKLNDLPGLPPLKMF